MPYSLTVVAYEEDFPFAQLLICTFKFITSVSAGSIKLHSYAMCSFSNLIILCIQNNWSCSDHLVNFDVVSIGESTPTEDLIKCHGPAVTCTVDSLIAVNCSCNFVIKRACDRVQNQCIDLQKWCAVRTANSTPSSGWKIRPGL